MAPPAKLLDGLEPNCQHLVENPSDEQIFKIDDLQADGVTGGENDAGGPAPSGDVVSNSHENEVPIGNDVGNVSNGMQRDGALRAPSGMGPRKRKVLHESVPNVPELGFRAMIFYNFMRGLNSVDCETEMKELFGDEAPPMSTIQKWFLRFEAGDFNLDDLDAHEIEGENCAGGNRASSDDAVPNSRENAVVNASNGRQRDIALRAPCGSPVSPISLKRENYLSWEEYFMSMTFLSAMRSKDPVSQVGACIVNPENKIVGIGYNGMPNGCSDDLMPWGKDPNDPLNNKHLYVVHAEQNAIMNKNTYDVKGCTIYVALFPCNECAKLIIQSGIKSVIYFSDKHADKVPTMAAKLMFDHIGLPYRKFNPKRRKVTIDFEAINRMGPRKRKVLLKSFPTVSDREYRAIFFYNFMRGLNSVDCETEMKELFGDEAPSMSTIQKWYQRFKAGDFNLDDEPRAPKPSCTENVERVRGLLEDNKRVTIRKIADELNLTFNDVQKIIQRDLGFTKRSSSWVPNKKRSRTKKPDHDPAEEVIPAIVDDLSPLVDPLNIFTQFLECSTSE
ncbi:unnamed protein product [Notodromas monacha]|uniref:Probable deoxycytidylate deaminase n=1 Tax=Notodromas monacha TaxID=399045 RepID=A0A7R9GCI2_9CRUS|nr:unnamed protein product [Notodromas monacha]CAG0917466.1 unnamed protein product [Notodromas monacha]